MKCSNEICNKEAFSRGLCKSHYMYWWRYGRGHAEESKRAAKRTGCIDSRGYVKIEIRGKSTYEHILLAEKALGKPLPKGAIVHHTGERHENHGPFKLVICPNQEYHSLIHKRMKELEHENN